MKTMKCYSTPRSTPSHVRICLERLRATLADAAVFLESIDPVACPDHAEMQAALGVALVVAHRMKAPEKAAKAAKESIPVPAISEAQAAYDVEERAAIQEESLAAE